MKKILCAILAGLCIVSASALTAFADDQEFTTYTEAPDTPGEELLFATGDMDDLTGYDAKGGIGVDLHNLASGSVSFRRLIYRNDKKPPKAYFLPMKCTL